MHDFYRLLRAKPVVLEEPAFDPEKQQDVELENGHKAYTYRLDGKLCFKQNDLKSKKSFKKAIRHFCERLGLPIKEWIRTQKNNVVAIC